MVVLYQSRTGGEGGGGRRGGGREVGMLQSLLTWAINLGEGGRRSSLAPMLDSPQEGLMHVRSARAPNELAGHVR